MQMEMNGKIVLSTDDSWRLCRDPSRKQQTEYISGHRGGFKEICDAAREIIGWKDLGYDDSRWVRAHILGPVGRKPWKNLIPRETPPLRLETVYPKDIFYTTTGKTYGAAKYDVADPEALRQGSNGTTTVHPLGRDFAPSLIIDFGKSLYGFFEIEIEDSRGGSIEICYGESLNLTLVDTLIMSNTIQ